MRPQRPRRDSILDVNRTLRVIEETNVRRLRCWISAMTSPAPIAWIGMPAARDGIPHDTACHTQVSRSSVVNCRSQLLRSEMLMRPRATLASGAARRTYHASVFAAWQSD